jgi:DNA-binding transcriptional MerR regulator
VLTISQLAAYAGVTVRAVRHYHQIGLLPEPERDRSGYRRYGAHAAVSLVKIATLADAGVPLSEIADLVEADEETFAAAVGRIDGRLGQEISRLQRSRTSIARLAAGDALVLPPEVVVYLNRLRELGVSGPVIEGERDGWILMTARWPDRVREWMPGKLASLEDPRIVRLYQVLSQLFEKSEVNDPLMEEAADLMAELANQAWESGQRSTETTDEDAVSFDLLELLALESDPRTIRMVELMRQRGWDGWTRLEKVPPKPGQVQ